MVRPYRGRRFLSLLFVLINLKYSESVLNRSDLLPTPDRSYKITIQPDLI